MIVPQNYKRIDLVQIIDSGDDGAGQVEMLKLDEEATGDRSCKRMITYAGPATKEPVLLQRKTRFAPVREHQHAPTCFQEPSNSRSK